MDSWCCGTEKSRPLDHCEKIPEITRVRFSNEGRDIDAWVRPWAEDLDREKITDSLDAYYKLVLPDAVTLDWNDLRLERQVSEQIARQQPKNQRELESLEGVVSSQDAIRTVLKAFDMSNLKTRSAIWDVAILESDSDGFVHDGCLFDVVDARGDLCASFQGRGYGSQILRAPNPIVYVVEPRENGDDPWDNRNALLMQRKGNRFDEIACAQGRYTFSIDDRGILLGRPDRSSPSESERYDLIVDSRSKNATRFDLGHYDVSNRYLRVDSAPQLFFIQGAQNSLLTGSTNMHSVRYVGTCSPSGRVKRLWPLIEDRRGHASHVSECCFCYVWDSEGPGLIVSGKHSRPTDATYRGFMYRRNLDGRELWRCATKAGVSSMHYVSQLGVVMVAFLDGDFVSVRAIDGVELYREQFTSNGIAGVVYLMCVGDTYLSVGTIDGRCALMPLSQLAGKEGSGQSTP